MQDKPSADELLDALAEFLENDVVPAFEGRKRFHAIVAANVARIAAREFRFGPPQRTAEIAELRDLLGDSSTTVGESEPSEYDLVALTAELCRRIEQGEADAGEFRRRAFGFLRRSTERKLAIDDPKRRGR